MKTKRGDMLASPQFSLNAWRDPAIRGGMTIRERFAMAAMQGLLASGPHDCDEHGLAHDAVLNADALLAELERTK